MNFYNEFISKKQDILIPSIQRDYVQGSSKNLAKGIIQSFLGTLVKALIGEKSINLTYIYGYNENNCFVPIDGQQRLTTLWLLYTYIYAHNGLTIPIKLKYESREFAQDFLEILPEHLKEILACKEVNNLKQAIIDAPWYISSWSKDLTVESCINTLNEIHKLLYNNEDVGGLMNGISCNNITFSFYRLDGKMNADTYIKMNGRGRILSDFENLKSWLDDFVEKEFDPDSNFCSEWKKKMDNDWASMFWVNRNKTQAHPEEIDDEQLRYFYNMLYIYWMKQKSPKFITNPEDRSRIAELLEIRDSNKIEDVVLEHIRKSDSFGYSLYILEELHLITCDFIEYFSKATDAICDNYARINELSPTIANMWRKVDDHVRLTYSIFFDSESEITYATLVLANALISYVIKYRKQCEHLEDWLRVWRNLTENHTISNSNINTILQKTDEFIEIGEEDILNQLVSQEIELPFPKKIVDEEIEKAKQIAFEGWKEKIYNAENFSNFHGAISFLITDDTGTLGDWNNFDKKWKFISEKLYVSNGQKDEPNWEYLCNYVSYADCKIIPKILNDFSSTKGEWRKNLLNPDLYEVNHHFLLQDGHIHLDEDMVFDLYNLLGIIKSPVWIMNNWQGCKYVLTNYQRRLESFSNGWVYVINTKRNKYVDELKELERQGVVSDVIIPSCYGDECITINDTHYYRGLYTDFMYRDVQYRLKESSIVKTYGEGIYSEMTNIINDSIIQTIESIIGATQNNGQ